VNDEWREPNCYHAFIEGVDGRMATLELTKDNFKEIVTKNDMMIVDFWAPWCGRMA